MEKGWEGDSYSSGDPQLDQGCSKVTLVPFKDRADFPMLPDDPKRSQNYKSYLFSFSRILTEQFYYSYDIIYELI